MGPQTPDDWGTLMIALLLCVAHALASWLLFKEIVETAEPKVEEVEDPRSNNAYRS